MNEAFKFKVRYSIIITLLFVSIATLLVYSIELILMLFTGVLIAIFLRGIACEISRLTKLNVNVSLVLIILILAAATYFSLDFMYPHLSSQLESLIESVPDGVNKINEWLSGHEWIESLLSDINVNQIVNKNTLSKAGGSLTKLIKGLVLILIIFFTGIYFAVKPGAYVDGILSLFPNRRREEVGEIFNKIETTLKWWLIGRFIDMAFIGVLIWAGLTFLNIPLALILACIAAILNFIPNIGPFIGAVPAILVTVSTHPESLLWVILLFTVIQTLETVFLTPMVQEKAISLPPVLTISSQILLGTYYGTLGLAVATPIMAVFIVLIKEIYIKRIENKDQ